MELHAAVATDNIPVEITIRIGRRRITVAELSMLKENDILPLDQGVEEGVEICVGDHVIAYGELVEGEGDADRLMLRITRAAHQGA
ncbi:MAG: FliM/FliN family flagellar motor switch protein [Paracoccus sp. (in: a-proteobacteria)]|nr:FliM/FliN family flagellar motor switch protein [Paracoccus sp. (in: a-proteobacteria)]